MSTRIILVRHGESLGNVKSIFLGQTDWDLTERGYQQAELTADYLENYDIDVCYASSLKRAYNTAKVIAERHSLEIIESKPFREIYAGKWEAMLFDDINEKYAKDYAVWKTDIGNARCTDGESVKELQERVVAEYNRLAEVHQGKTVLIGTHATPIRLLKCRLLGRQIDYAKNISWTPNASVTVIDADSGKILIDGYAEHLGGLCTKFNGKV